MAVDGGTESIRACCFDAIDGTIIGQSCASPYTTYHPQPGWAEQHPKDWYEQLGSSVRNAIQSLPKEDSEEDDDDSSSSSYEICAICLDTTCCSVVVLDDMYEPLRPALLWMDARSALQTKEILKKCKGDKALRINCGGEGPLSAEWMTPKSLWIYQNEPEIWNQANTICEYQDYLNYKLTGQMVASSCNAASRWHWNGEECILNPEETNDDDKEKNEKTKKKTKPYPGRPLSMYKKLGISSLAEKLPQKCIPMGTVVGRLTKDAAQHLNLPIDLPVIQGGPDAFVGMIGLGCIHPGQLCLITGSSHLHCVVTSKPTTARGTWGAYRGAPLPGMNFAEGGQSSTGSIVRWAKNKVFQNDDDTDTLSYKELDEEASQILPGCDGLVALETFQGSRTPVTDPLARGALLGMTLSHTRGHMWRALMEGVCYGTKACIDGLSNAGHVADEIIIAGGTTRSPLWLQMHADVTGLPVVVCENGGDAPLLGCAILASLGVGIHESIEDAVKSMVRQERRVLPNDAISNQYKELYDKVYSKVGNTVRPVAHAIAELRGGADSVQQDNRSSSIDGESTIGSSSMGSKKDAVIISPSLLASDWSNMQGEVQRCIEAGATQLHVDIFDGVFIDSPHAFTFGPPMVHGIRRACNKSRPLGLSLEKEEDVVLDLHMCVDRPERYVIPMADAGGTRFIFQWEAMLEASDNDDDVDVYDRALENAYQLAQKIIASGMKCGVSINPATTVSTIYPLLKTGMIDLVDILAVEAGFGGQSFQIQTIDKVHELIQFRTNSGLQFQILVDGGINIETAPAVMNAGADILVAGTYLFQRSHPLND